MFSDREVIGSSYTTLFFAGVGYYIYSFMNYGDNKDLYDEAYKNYLNSTTPEEMYKYSKVVNKYRDEIDFDLMGMSIAIGVAGGIYVLNVIDAIFFTPDTKTVSYTVKKYTEKDLSSFFDYDIKNNIVKVGLNYKF